MSDFELIARVLDETPRESHPLIDEVLDAIDRDRAKLAEAFADELSVSNPRFDRERFMRACGA